MPSTPLGHLAALVARCPRLRIPVPSAPLGHLTVLGKYVRFGDVVKLMFSNSTFVLHSRYPSGAEGTGMNQQSPCFSTAHRFFTAGTRAEPRAPGFPQHIKASWEVPERSRGYRVFLNTVRFLERYPSGAEGTGLNQRSRGYRLTTRPYLTQTYTIPRTISSNISIPVFVSSSGKL